MSTVQDKAIHTLTGLGITVLQARVYLALLKSGKTTAKDLAKTSKVARQDTYRVLSELHNLGLIEKLIDTPTKFKAIPIEVVIAELVERRKKDSSRLEKDAAEMLQSFSTPVEENNELEDEEYQFVIIKELQSRMMRVRKQITETKKSICVVTRWPFFVTYTINSTEEIIKALKRGVNIRIVTQKPEQVEPLSEDLQTLMKYPLFQVKYATSLPPSIVATFDKKEVNISIISDTNPSESPLLQSNNQSLIELAQNYFEVMWTHAQ